jgi:prevent-host-death family protein
LTAEAGVVSTGTWTLAQARAKFGAVVDKALKEGRQIITRNGRTVVVVVSAEEWDRKTREAGTLADFFSASPLRNSGIQVPRMKGGMRKIDL